MGDPELMLREVLANPDDDTVRLAYADALGERGRRWDDWRAELIRVQVRLARGPDWLPPGQLVRNAAGEVVAVTSQPTEDPVYLAAADREKEMLKSVPVVALDPLAELKPPTPELLHRGMLSGAFLGVSVFRCEFRRGLVEEVECDGNDWARRGDAALERHPIRRVAFRTLAPLLEPMYYDGSLRVERWRIAGLVVEVPDEDLLDLPPQALPPDGRRVADHNARVILSKRWPRIPPGGWSFPGPETAERVRPPLPERTRR